MTSYQKRIIFISYFIGIIATIIYVTPPYDIVFVTMICYALMGAVYFGLTGYTMFIFTRNMYKLAKTRNDPHHEQVLLYATTKYVSLLSLAILSTWMELIMSIIVTAVSYKKTFEERSEHSLLDNISIGNLVSIDCVTNIICLYLQYPFNRKYYDKYCVCLKNCCIRVLLKQTGQNELSQLQIAKSSSKSITIEEPVDVTSTTATEHK